MIAICREVDKNGGGIAVYPIESEVTERLLTCLTLRARLNPELRYFVTARVRWENESARKLIENSLRRKNVTASTIAAVGGACGAMSEEPKILASISGGKDSLAALITHIESGGRCDGAVYCRIMFDDETSAEYPEHEDFLFNKCFPTLEREYGVKTTIVQQSYTYVERFHKIITRNTKNKGRIYGFPFIRGSWCNSDLKLHPLRKFKKEIGEFIEIVGIAADETERAEKKTVTGKILPLVEHGITEAGAFEVCRRRGLLSPGYCKGRTRLGCWFCHCQRIGELKRLYYDYPQLWDKLAALDIESPTMFKPDGRLSYYAGRFSREGQQTTLFSEEGGP